MKPLPSANVNYAVSRRFVQYRAERDTQRADLQQRLHTTTPRSVFGADTATADGQVWTVPDLRRALQQWYGVTYASLTSYRTVVARCSFSYQRATTVYKSRNARAVLDWEAQIEKN